MGQYGENRCPKCGFGFFDTEPNQYEILQFTNGDFKEVKTEGIDKTDLRIYCRSCRSEIEKNASIKRKKVVLISSEE